MPTGTPGLAEACRARLAAAADTGDIGAMWSVPWQLTPKPGDVTWDHDLAEALVSTVESELIFNPGGHCFFEALVVHHDRLSGDHLARVLEAAEQIVRTIIPGSNIAPVQFMAVHWISCAVGTAEALNVFKRWAEDAFALGLPDLMACALSGLRSYGELTASEGDGAGSTSLHLDQLDPPLTVELEIPFAGFLAALQAEPPVVDADYLMPSLLRSLPEGQPARDRKPQEVSAAITGEIQHLPPRRRELTLRALVSAIMATRREGEPVWTDARLSVFMDVLGDDALCAEPGVASFVEVIGKQIGYLSKSQRDRLCDLLMRRGDLLATNHQTIDAIVDNFPFGTATAVLDRWHQCFSHPASTSPNPVLAGAVAQARLRAARVKADQRAAYSALTIHIEDDGDAIDATAPKTVANANRPNLLLLRMLGQSQATLEQAIETQDEVAIWATPWEVFDTFARIGWYEELARFLISGLRNSKLMESAGSHAWLEALSRFRSWLPAMAPEMQAELSTLIWDAAMSAAESSLTHDAARYKAIQLLKAIDAQKLLDRLSTWSEEAAHPRKKHMMDSVLMGYIHLAAYHGWPASRIRITTKPSGAALSLFIPEEVTHSVPAARSVLERRRNAISSQDFARTFEPQRLLDAARLPADPKARGEYITRAAKKILKTLAPLADNDRAQVIAALPDAIMQTRAGIEPIWNSTRFDLFLRVFDEPALCSQAGAAAFLITLHNHWQALKLDQRAILWKTLQARMPNYKNETFRRGAANLLKLTAPFAAAQFS